jgi:uncharacterized protein (DUF1684 family)
MIRCTRVLLICVALSAGTASAAATCLDSLETYRAKKADEFLKSADSPFSAAFRKEFAGFSYYDGDAAYCVDAEYVPLSGSRTVDYPAFNGKTIPFRKAGVFHFRLMDRPQSLVAFQRMDLPEDQRQWLLVMFKDPTNGKGTYGGGRYLQIDLPVREHTVLDFNRADNPLCAYQEQFACPMPPAENWLRIAIPVGEKDYTGHRSPPAPAASHGPPA